MARVWVTSAVGVVGWGVRRFLSGTGVSIEVTQKKTGSGGVCGVVRGESRQKSAVKGIDVRQVVYYESRNSPF